MDEVDVSLMGPNMFDGCNTDVSTGASVRRKIGRRGSALVGAIWILAVLSVLIATYAVDAQLQTRINLYLQERVRVDHLTDAGIIFAAKQQMQGLRSQEIHL